MSKKSEARAARRAAKTHKHQVAQGAADCAVVPEKLPRMAAAPNPEKLPNVAPHKARQIHEPTRTPRTAVTADNWNSSVTWCVTRCDEDGTWGWGEPRQVSVGEWRGVIRPAFANFCDLTWAEIDKFASGSGHKMHHSHEISEIAAEAQRRWLDIGLEEYDTLFRFRLGGQRCRAWGFKIGAHFHMVWYERHHRIYNVS